MTQKIFVCYEGDTIKGFVTTKPKAKMWCKGSSGRSTAAVFPMKEDQPGITDLELFVVLVRAGGQTFWVHDERDLVYDRRAHFTQRIMRIR